MERFPFFKKIDKVEDYLAVRVTKHSKSFDQEISQKQNYSSEETKAAWQTRQWNVGETNIQALGVSHVPETFLCFRAEIEKAIEESDLVVTEFAPEALGFYDSSQAEKLKGIKSKINENYNLEELRQAYLKYERDFNLGIFHHEVELLAAKYKKKIAVADLSFSQKPEDFFQENELYLRGAQSIEKQKTKKDQLLGYVGGGLLGISGLNKFLEDLYQIDSKKMNRRDFLKAGLKIGGGLFLAGAVPSLMNNSKDLSKENVTKKDSIKDDLALLKKRDLILAQSLEKLAEMGYRKIAFIYGTNHLEKVEKYLNHPNLRAQELEGLGEKKDEIDSDVLKIYQLVSGRNISDRFVASKELKWQRLEEEKNS